MKNTVLILMLLLFLTVGCGRQKSNQENAQSSQDIENVDTKKEINTLDSAAKQLENTQNEIEESSKELDEALDDL